MRTSILALLLSGALCAQDSQSVSGQMQSGQTEAAIASLRKQIEISPGNFAAHANLGTLYYQLQRYTEAVPELEKAAAINPEDTSNQINLGGAYVGIGQTEQGLAVLNQVVQGPLSADTLSSVAYCLASHQLQLERAQKYAESAVGMSAAELRVTDLDHITPRVMLGVSALASFWDTLGWVHFQRGNLDEASKFFNAAWMLNQQGASGDHLGQLYERRGQKQEGIQAFAEALAAGGVLQTRNCLAALVGTEDQIGPLVRVARDELLAMRTFKVGKLLAEKASADFYIAQVPAQGISEVKFLRGDERLRQFTNALQAAALPGVFPDATATMLVRRGTLTCPGDAGECVIELLTATEAAKAESNGMPPVFRAGGVVTPPKVLHKVEPEYSKEANKAKLSGTVVLYVEVGPDGKAHNVRVVRSLGMGLDERAIEAVKKWKFRPGVKDGKAVTVAATIQVNFRMY